jgi:hypothetical protein
MFEFRQVGAVAAYNFRTWRRNPRIVITFLLAFTLCFLLSDKTVRFAQEYKTSMQIAEAFIWTFADSNSILLASLLLVLLFADLPNFGPGVPYYLMRTSRRTWMLGQIVYVVLATLLYLLFILVCTSLICMNQSFIGNMWSETAAILGYSGAGKAVALPATVKTLEMSTPYPCMATIFALMLLYTLLMMSMMLAVNIRRGHFWGIVSVFALSLYGFLVQPATFNAFLQLPQRQIYIANVLAAWVSPLQQATYSMHNFGYDRLPRLWMTYALYAGGILLFFFLSLRAMRRHSFSFAAESN